MLKGLRNKSQYRLQTAPPVRGFLFKATALAGKNGASTRQSTPENQSTSWTTSLTLDGAIKRETIAIYPRILLSTYYPQIYLETPSP